MRTEAKNAEALYVLGDLFEFWVGDDDKTPFANQIRTEFKALTDQGVPVFLFKAIVTSCWANAFVKRRASLCLMTFAPSTYMAQKR